MKQRAREAEAISTFSTDRLAALRNATEVWINSTDGKAMALLGAGGGALALTGLQTTQRTVSSMPLVSSIFLSLFCCLGVMSCVSAVCCLWPRTDRKRPLRDRDIQPLPRSPSVFWELGDLDAASFSASAVDVTEEELRRDTLEQAMFATWVAKQKLYYLKLTIALFLGALFALFTALFASLL
ncbi:hypothetical protein [Polyangium aurulentum]|uniref:hypothetical protein n=1 Tax=Polyangium aurulentum TaxID=2567896 RepID=UPI0010ADBC55|nr:hypothetical protein [Polyangium aurulentum]UQA59906.1 hypothetical protein E8A73_005280 [Polyangium aurulentum]